MRAIKSKKIHFTYEECLSDIYIVAMLLVLPLWFNPDGYRSISTAKFQCFFVLTALYILLLYGGRLELRLVGKPPYKPGKYTGIHYTTFLFLGLCAVSSLMSAYREIAFSLDGTCESLWAFVGYVIVFLLVSQFAKPKWWHIVPVAVAVCVNGVICVLQYWGLNPFALYPEGMTYHDASIKYSSSFMGTFGNVGLLSAYLAMAVIALGIVYILGTSKSTHILLFPVFLGTFCLFLIDVAAGILAFVGTIFLLLPWVLTSGKRLYRGLICMSAIACGVFFRSLLTVEYVQSQTSVSVKWSTLSTICLVLGVGCAGVSQCLRTRKICILQDPKQATRQVALFVGGVGIIAISALYLVPFSGGTLGEFHAVLHGDIRPEFGSFRIQVWREVWALIPDKLLFGGGPGTLVQRLDYNFTRYIPDLNITVNAFVDTAHNDYLNILVNTGLLSLLAYLVVLGWVIYLTAKNRKRPVVLVLSSAITAYLIQAFFSFGSWAVTPVFWLLLGLLVATTRMEERK